MGRSVLFLVLAVLLGRVAPCPAQAPASVPQLPCARDERATGNGKNGGEETEGQDKKANGAKEPKHIRDNAFLVEEAANQEPGVVQHIFNWVNVWDRAPRERTRDLAFAYTMELPLGSQTHQFSFTTLFVSNFSRPNDGPAEQQGGVGDTILNYRYQLLADDNFLWCAPRFGLILPTGDERFGLGRGQLGYLFNLPISRYTDLFDFHFNAGFIFIPNVAAFLNDGSRSPRQDPHVFNLGVSAFWKPKTNLHFFVEALWLESQDIDNLGFRDHLTQVFINPGVRWAVYQGEEVEWVLGVSVPVGVTRDAPDIGVFAYMSIEHDFRKSKKKDKD